MDKRRAVLAFGTLAIVGFLGASFLRASVKATETPEAACQALGARPFGGTLRPGQPAPDFELTDAAGKKWSLAGLRGKRVLLSFWATWCVPCAREMPSIERVSRRLGDRLTVVTVSVDETWDAVKAFFPRGTTLPVLLDPGEQVTKLYGTEKFPETFLIDSEGRLQRLFYEADWDAPQVESCLASLR
jgi:peroxiredoxin